MNVGEHVLLDQERSKRRRGRTAGARRAWGGIEREGGILYIFPGQAHMSRLANSGNLTKGGRNGVEDKKV